MTKAEKKEELSEQILLLMIRRLKLSKKLNNFHDKIKPIFEKLSKIAH